MLSGNLDKTSSNSSCNNSSQSDAKSASSATNANPDGGRHDNLSEASTMTDPDLIGPCQPGTAVKLQGVVLSESDKGT